MPTNLKIIRRKDGTFTGTEGDPIPYFWYKAVRLEDGVTIEFGSREGGHEEGTEVELLIEKYEKPGGGFRYKEVV